MLDYLFGTVKFCVDNAECLNNIVVRNIQCTKIEYKCDGIEFTVSFFNSFKVRNILKENGIAYTRKNINGIPAYILRYRKRWGISVGAILFSVITFMSGRYIWSFDISGNNTVPDEEILSILNDLGCSVGTKISSIDFDMLHNDFLIRSDNISWISVNMDGTKANIEVREVKKGNEISRDLNNIIANEDGQISLISVVKGKPQVVIGDVVRKGDILISGVSTYREGEKNYYADAQGEIYATVNRKFVVEIQRASASKDYTGQITDNKSLKFFGFSINLFPNSRIQYSNYDTIVDNRQIVLFDSVYLPLWIETVEYKEYNVSEYTLSESEAKIKAIKEYKDKLAELTKDVELINIDTKHSSENGVYRIECSMYCIADIAEKAPFTIDYERQE